MGPQLREPMVVPQKNFEANPESVHAVRRFVAGALPGGFRSDDIVLTASELATNVVRCARTHFSVLVLCDNDRALLEVSDGSSTISAIEGLVDHRWGLRAIEAVSDRWGIESTATSKTLWVEFAQTHSHPYLRANHQRPTS